MRVRPKPRDPMTIDLSELIEACEEQLNRIDDDPTNEDYITKMDHYIYEEAMKAVYGRDIIFAYINAKM